MPGPDTDHHQRIAAALEPEVRRIIDVTMERVAAIEQQSMQEARQAQATSEHEYAQTRERSSRLAGSVDAATQTVNEITSALQAEVDEVTAALRGLHGLRVQLPDEIADRHVRDEPEPPKPLPDPAVEPGPELTEMYRHQITQMRDDGRSREEAERVLKRFKFGRRFLGMLDEIYLAEPPRSARSGRRSLFGRRRGRG